MVLNPDRNVYADLLSQLIELKNFISKLQYSSDGSYIETNQGDNNISLDRITQLTSLYEKDSISIAVNDIKPVVDAIKQVLDDIKLVVDGFIDETTLLSEINDIRNRINNIRNALDNVKSNVNSIKISVDQLINSDFHLIISSIDEKLETIRDTSKIVSYIPYKFDNVGVCEQRVAYLYDNGTLVDSSMNPITIASIESDIGFCV